MADIDFANADSRMKFLQENLGHLMNGIDKNYGQVLMDELMKRLEKTVSEFNEEVKAMLNQLQAKEAETADEIFSDTPKIKADAGKPIIDIEQGKVGLSEFEKRLDSLDQ